MVQGWIVKYVDVSRDGAGSLTFMVFVSWELAAGVFVLGMKTYLGYL